MKNFNTKTAFLSIIFSLFFTSQQLHAQQWSAMGAAGIAGGSGSTNNLGVANGIIYDGGIYNGSIKQWNGDTSWTMVGGGFAGTYPSVSLLTEFKGELYVGGSFDSVTGLGGLHNLARWNGTSWSGVGGGITSTNKAIYCMFVYDSMLYIGGMFDSVGGVPAKNIARWDGTTWSAINSAMPGMYAYVNVLGEYNGNLIASGDFDSIGGVAARYIAMWNGTSWSALGTGLDNPPGCVFGSGNTLYIGGYNVDSAGGVPVNRMAKWNGTAWSAWGTGASGYGYVYKITSYNGNIIIGGIFDTVNGIAAHNIAQFDGTSWSGVGGGIDSANGDPFVNVASLVVSGGNLYVSGNFSLAGAKTASGIARWGAPLSGINSVAENNTTIVYPNPGNGKFSIELKNITEQPLLDVYNILGQKVYHSILNNDKTEVDISHQAIGTYLYRVTSKEGELVSSGKYVVE